MMRISPSSETEVSAMSFDAFRAADCGELIQRVDKALLSSVQSICASEGIAFRHCKHNVLNRK